MRSTVSSQFSWLACVLFVLGSTGCVKTMLVNGQIASTRQASSVLDEVGDLEIVRTAAQGGLIQFEGMHQLAPSNEDALFMLTKGWVSYGFGFCEDDMDAAKEAGNSALEAYHRERAEQAYMRAVKYGRRLLALKSNGFDVARKSEQSLRSWLSSEFKTERDGENLFWTSYAWMANTAIHRDNPEIVADLWVGASLMERSAELNPNYNSYGSLTALASYHARAASAELEQAKVLFERALELTKRKSLLVQFAYATRYACAKQDAVLYEKLLDEVVNAPNEESSVHLQNTIAKKRAKRWLTANKMFDECSMDPVPGGIVARHPNR